MFRDGQQISFIGLDRGLNYGEAGRILEAGTESSAILWKSGSVTTQYNSDLLPVGKIAFSDGLDDCLEVGEPLRTSAAREAFDIGGESAVLNYMSESGHLASMSDIAEDAMAFVSARLRQDQYFRSILSQLDDDEGDSLVNLASRVALRQIGFE
jgi:hypothetical protein